MWLICKYPLLAAPVLFPVAFAAAHRFTETFSVSLLLGIVLALVPTAFVFFLGAFPTSAKPKTKRFLVTNRRVISWDVGYGSATQFAYPGSEISHAILIEGKDGGAILFTLLLSDPVGMPVRASLFSGVPDVLEFAAAIKAESWGRHVQFEDAEGRELRIPD